MTSVLPTPLPSDVPSAVDDFVRLSEVLTGFDGIELFATGMVRAYYDHLLLVIGAREAGSLFGEFRRVEAGPPSTFDERFRAGILASPRYGPVARNVIRMWYLGAWAQLPREWRDAYGATSYDVDCVVSAAAYREGLVWPAAGTHPMGAKQPGYGSWSVPSSLPGDDDGSEAALAGVPPLVVPGGGS